LPKNPVLVRGDPARSILKRASQSGVVMCTEKKGRGRRAQIFQEWRREVRNGVREATRKTIDSYFSSHNNNKKEK